IFFSYAYAILLAFHSFPPRRSSDLMALLVADDAVEIGTDLVSATLFKSMARRTFLGRRRTLLGARRGQQHLDRLTLFRRLLLTAGGLLFHRNLETGLARLVLGKDRAGRNIEHQHGEADAENRAQNLIEFKGVHRQGPKSPIRNVGSGAA